MAEPIILTSTIKVEPIQHMGGDHMVVAAARVSTSGSEAEKWADPTLSQDNGRLINYLMKHRHGTPFEHAAITFFCHAPIFVWREWHRHRVGFSYNEESARWGELGPVFWIPRRDRPVLAAPGHRSAHPKLAQCDDETYERLVERSRAVYQMCYDAYRAELDEGFASEVARRHLPVAIYSSCWVTCNPRSLMHFLSLRTHEPDAKFVSYPQAEIEEAARIAEHVLETGWPLTYQAFQRNGRVGP